MRCLNINFLIILQMVLFQMKLDPNLKQWVGTNAPEGKKQAPSVPPSKTVSVANPTTS